MKQKQLKEIVGKYIVLVRTSTYSSQQLMKHLIENQQEYARVNTQQHLVDIYRALELQQNTYSLKMHIDLI